MVAINLFAGPGVGKSTLAAGVFHGMKLKHFNVELIQEYAKDLVYSTDKTRLADQLLILAEQHHRLVRVMDNVDYTINESPFLMGTTYTTPDSVVCKDALQGLAISMFKKYDNINILLVRNETIDYKLGEGRHQTLEQAIQKDREVHTLLASTDEPYYIVRSGPYAVAEILEIIDKELNEKVK